MNEVPVYMIANLVIQDADTYRKYEKGFFPLLKKYEGSFITYDDNIETLGCKKGVKRKILTYLSSKETILNRSLSNCSHIADYVSLLRLTSFCLCD